MIPEFRLVRPRHLALILLLPACLCVKFKLAQLSGDILYRGDLRAPEIIRKAGGFLPPSSDADDGSFGLYQHTRLPRVKDSTQYVSTSKDMGIAALYAAVVPDGALDIEIESSWVYLVRPTPNCIDARKTLGSYAVDFPHQEFAALGGIRWEQVLGWMEIGLSPRLEIEIKNMGARAAQDLREQMQSGELILNPDYTPVLDDSKASGAVPQLAGFPKDHQAWERRPWINFPVSESTTLKTYAVAFMDAHREQLRWRGEFPLFGRLDLYKKASTKVVEAAQAAVETAADALVDHKLHTAALTAMRAEQEAAQARVWLERFARVFDDHSFLAVEGFKQAETYWQSARDAAARAHWRRQTLIMQNYRQEASELASQMPQLASNPEERRKRVSRARTMLKIVPRVEEQVQHGLRMHAATIRVLKDALPPNGDERALAEAEFVWLQFRESRGDAIARELSALRGEQRGLQSGAFEISMLAREANSDIIAFLERVHEIDATLEPLAEDEVAETESRSMVDVALEVALEVMSLLPTPAAPVLQILKWGRRAWNALRIARRVHKISKARKVPARPDRLQRLFEISARLEAMLKMKKRPLLSSKPETLRTEKSMDDIIHDIDSVPVFEEESAGASNVATLLRELEEVKIPTKPPFLDSEPRSLEHLLQELDQLEVPQFALEQEAPLSDELGRAAVPALALADRSQPSGPQRTPPTPDRESLLDLILFKLSGMLGRQPILTKWTALDEITFSLNATSIGAT